MKISDGFLTWFSSPAGGFFISSLIRGCCKWYLSICFRPLTGSFLFHLLLFRLMKKGSLFPSPAGVLFISSSVLLSESGQIYVSVPCWGLFYFIILNVKQNMKSCQYCFRPLPGSFLFHPLSNTFNEKFVELFPSPAGVFFISSQQGCAIFYSFQWVSVPCRGLFYFIPVPDIPVYIRGYQLICGVKI